MTCSFHEQTKRTSNITGILPCNSCYIQIHETRQFAAMQPVSISDLRILLLLLHATSLSSTITLSWMHYKYISWAPWRTIDCLKFFKKTTRLNKHSRQSNACAVQRFSYDLMTWWMQRSRDTKRDEVHDLQLLHIYTQKLTSTIMKEKMHQMSNRSLYW